MKETIVISAVNLVDGGTFTILKQCLDSISGTEFASDYNVLAIINNKKLLPDYNDIGFIEYPKSKKHYLYRFYYEYFKFKQVSKKYHVKLWLSLHDMSPFVKADVQAVYMHNPSPFLGRPKRLTLRGIGFSSLYRYIYRINIHSNDYLIVQQDWLRKSFSQMFKVPKEKIIVARPAEEDMISVSGASVTHSNRKTFVYASYPREFKNFELICEAAKILEGRRNVNFRVMLTIDGRENSYSKKLVETYSMLETVDFVGLQPREKMSGFYEQSDCLIFPSRAETWGLPISEYKRYNKPMILADLPYAHETAEGARLATFTNPNNAEELAKIMEEVIQNDFSKFTSIPVFPVKAPVTANWNEMFTLLLNSNNG